jgi:hypothetical protein
MVCRTLNPVALNTAGQAIDPRVNIIACPKKWKEADVWKCARCGERDLWARARTGEYLKKSRAFTEELPQWDYDDIEEMGGESGL